MTSKLVDEKYIIDPEGKRLKDSRVEVTVMHSGNVDEWKKTQIYHKIEGDKFTKLNQIRIDSDPEVRKVFEHIRDKGDVPPKTKLVLICPDKEHGGIAVANKPGSYLMDMSVLLSNKEKDNLRGKGDGPFEKTQHYVPNTVLYKNIKEKDLVTIKSKIDIHKTNERVVERQTHYGTCRHVFSSSRMWKENKHLFSAEKGFLSPPNFHWMLTQKDANKYVQKYKDKANYIHKCGWSGEMHIPEERKQEILENSATIDIYPLYKMVFYEWDDEENLVIYFQNCECRGTYVLGQDNDWNWINIEIGETRPMCIAVLGWASIEGISPVNPQRDPPAHQGWVDKEITNGGTPASQSGFRFTQGFQYNNTEDRLVESEDDSGVCVYPGDKNLTSKTIANLDTLIEMTRKLQLLGAKNIDAGLEMSDVFDSIDAINKNLEKKLGNNK